MRSTESTGVEDARKLAVMTLMVLVVHIVSYAFYLATERNTSAVRRAILAKLRLA